jgi:hypothetical protein
MAAVPELSRRAYCLLPLIDIPVINLRNIKAEEVSKNINKRLNQD